MKIKIYLLSLLQLLFTKTIYPMQNSIQDLPNELIAHILYFTLQEDNIYSMINGIKNISQVNQNFRSLIKKEDFIINKIFENYLDRFNNKKI